MKTVVVNLIGSPGTGKSTVASELFAKMKWLRCSVELVSEFMKDLVWEERHKAIENELYTFAKQHHRIFRLIGKVDFIITDSPLILKCHYNKRYGDGSREYEDLVLHEVNKLDNLNVFLNRKKPYVEKGRNQTEKEADEFAVQILEMLDRLNVKYHRIDSLKDSASDKIMDLICKI